MCNKQISLIAFQSIQQNYTKLIEAYVFTIHVPTAIRIKPFKKPLLMTFVVAAITPIFRLDTNWKWSIVGDSRALACDNMPAINICLEFKLEQITNEIIEE